MLIGCGLAKNLCDDPPNEIRNTIRYKDDCFFELPQELIATVADSTYGLYRIKKAKAVGLCKHYNAYLPQLKDKNITEAFMTEALTKFDASHWTLILLGLTVKVLSKRKN